MRCASRVQCHDSDQILVGQLLRRSLMNWPNDFLAEQNDFGEETTVHKEDGYDAAEESRCLGVAGRSS